MACCVNYVIALAHINLQRYIAMCYSEKGDKNAHIKNYLQRKRLAAQCKASQNSNFDWDIVKHCFEQVLKPASFGDIAA